MKRGIVVKLVKFFHIIRISFARVFIIAVLLFLGSALLAIYSLIDFVNKVIAIYKSNPSFFVTLFVILVSIPVVSYGLEKGLNIYFQDK